MPSPLPERVRQLEAEVIRLRSEAEAKQPAGRKGR
jgi:hypothetical protein